MTGPHHLSREEVRAALIQRLARAGMDDAVAVAEFALAEALGCRRLDLRLKPDRLLTQAEADRVEAWAERLERREPLAHVLGHAEFLGRRFRCDRRALIPRPETELLVETALGLPMASPHARVADIGTGSGCIAISLALLRPAWAISAVDISRDALDLARENAALHGVDEHIVWRQASLLDGLDGKAFDLIVSNPPYICTGDIDHLQPEVRDHDPRLALDGGADGLHHIRTLVVEALAVLKPKGWLAMEIGEDQADPVTRWMSRSGFEKPTIRRDLAGHDRIVTAQRPL